MSRKQQGGQDSSRSIALPRWLADLLALEGRLLFLQRSGWWFWALIAVGALARVGLALFSEGTYDVRIWEGHARGVLEKGLAGAYRDSPELNHPPFACWVMAGLLRLGLASGIPFRALLRLPIALGDLASAFLLLRLLAKSRHRWLVSGLYAVYPLAVIFSGQHGNTDPVIAASVLLAMIFIVGGRPALAGAVLGASTWIKLPGVLAAPALFASLPGRRERALFAAAATLTGVVTYLPMLVSDPGLLYERVFAYRGQMIHTTGGLLIWGPQSLLQWAWEGAGPWRPALESTVSWWHEHDAVVILVPALALAWLRRRQTSAGGLGTTLCATFAIVYGFSGRFAFQYLSWGLPFWFLAGPAFCAGATLIVTPFIYGVYALLCGDPLLLGPWDFAGHPLWPEPLVLLRTLAFLFFATSAIAFLIAAARAEWIWRRRGSSS